MKLRSSRTIGTPATGLHDLPPELLDWVLSYADQIDLLNLSLVCTSFNKLVLPRLYSDYTNTNFKFLRPISIFLSRIAQHADLAHHVRRVELAAWTTKLVYLHPTFPYHIPALPDDQFDSFVAAAKQSGLVQEDQDCKHFRPIVRNDQLWCDYGPAYDSDGYDSDDLDELAYDSDSVSDPDADSIESSHGRSHSRVHDDVEFLRCLKHGLEDPQVLLLLSMLPRLQELSLRGHRMTQALPWDKLCSNSLTSLTKLKVAGKCEDSNWDFVELHTVIKLPSLRELHGYMAMSDEWDDDISNRYLNVEPNSLSLTHIYLERCSLGPRTIKNLIRGCKALEAFSYVTGGRYVGFEQFRAQEAKPHLLKHKATLKYLALDLSHWNFPRTFTSFKSMADFTSLEKVVMDYGTLRWKPTHHLAPVPLMVDDFRDEEDNDIHTANTQPPLPDLLPPSLKELIIFQAPPVVVENLLAFETSSRAQNPSLASIKIHTSRRRMTGVPNHSRLPAMFAEKGIAYAEPTVTMDFPIPQMYNWVVRPTNRRATRWNPRAKRYQTFASRYDYRRFCDEVLREGKDGGPPAPERRLGPHDEPLACDHHECRDALWDDDASSVDDEDDDAIVDHLMGFNQMYGGMVFPGNPLSMGGPVDFDHETESAGSYDSLTSDGSLDHDDDLEDDFDDDGLDSSDLSAADWNAHTQSLGYYEWEGF
ncbi:ring finger domain protein [Diplodia corticola]|uniref:Ring finger domain protein n=1 Tax=Diplodia corticola TaxID=236234 RepID=A0A1J9R3I0_9PEZI|nr:ring finger domain protein [Diplodia corticola]OJD35990.1 ring finger domain protein [Diplodia corticola]